MINSYKIVNLQYFWHDQYLKWGTGERERGDPGSASELNNIQTVAFLNNNKFIFQLIAIFVFYTNISYLLKMRSRLIFHCPCWSPVLMSQRYRLIGNKHNRNLQSKSLQQTHRGQVVKGIKQKQARCDTLINNINHTIWIL